MSLMKEILLVELCREWGKKYDGIVVHGYLILWQSHSQSYVILRLSHSQSESSKYMYLCKKMDFKLRFQKTESFNKLCPSQSSWMSFLHNVVYMFHPMPIATFKVQLQSSQSNRILHKIKQGLPSKKTVGKNNRIMACIKKNKLLKSRQTSFYSCHRTTHSLWTQYQP